MEQKATDFFEIDLLRLIKSLWKRAWVIVVTGILAAVLIGGYAALFVTPKYQANILLYINNTSAPGSAKNGTVTPSELSAAQSLVDTYVVILKSRTTLGKVIEKSGVDYTQGKLSRMISASSENGTEIFRVTVTAEDPEEAAMIANTVADVLPESIASVVDGSSVRVVDYAAVNQHKVSPNVKRMAAVGLLAGLLISAVIVVLIDLFDDVIRDEEYLTQTYNTPVLALIPDLTERAEGKYGYYEQSAEQDDKKGA